MGSAREFDVSIQRGVYPFLDVQQARPRPTSYDGDIHRKTEANLIAYYGNNQTRIEQALLGVVSPRLEILKRKPGSYAAVVGIPIGVETEQSEDIEPTVTSIAAAAKQVDRPTILVPYINYTAGRRNEQKKKATLQEAAERMGKDIVDMISDGSNMQLQTVITHEPPGTTWPQRRTALSDVALGTLHEYIWYSVFRSDGKWRTIHNTPFLQIDADTTVSEDTITTVADVLKEDEAIFVSGTTHYTGSIMNEAPADVARRDTNAKLLYFAEIMRRRMFDHLKPISLRGYLPDSNLGMKMGVFATLQGYDALDDQNESYFLQLAAKEAVGRQWGLEMPEQNYPEAYLDGYIVQRINGLVYYAPYSVDSSIRGIEANLSRHGRNALVDYDQGEGYITWSDFVQNPTKKQEPELTARETLPLINAIYSSFKDRGGVLPQEDGHMDRDVAVLGDVSVEDMNLQELFSVLFAESQGPHENVVFWRPLYVPGADRPKVTS